MHVAGLRGGMAPWVTIVNVKVMCAIKEPNCRAGTGGGLTQAISDITSEVSRVLVVHRIRAEAC